MPIQMPIGTEDSFQGIIDLVTNKAIVYRDELGEVIETIDVPPEYVAAKRRYREKLLEALAELDEALMVKYLDGEPDQRAGDPGGDSQGYSDLPVCAGALWII